MKADSSAHEVIRGAGALALNVLGRKQDEVVYGCFKPTRVEGDTLSGQPFRSDSTGAPILLGVPARVESRLMETLERGDHPLFVGEVIEAGAADLPPGRLDDFALTLKRLGEKVFHGG